MAYETYEQRYLPFYLLLEFLQDNGVPGHMNTWYHGGDTTITTTIYGGNSYNYKLRFALTYNYKSKEFVLEVGLGSAKQPLCRVSLYESDAFDCILDEIVKYESI